MRELLRVNMTNLTVAAEPVPEKWAKYGGRALTDATTRSRLMPTRSGPTQSSCSLQARSAAPRHQTAAGFPWVRRAR